MNEVDVRIIATLPKFAQDDDAFVVRCEWTAFAETIGNHISAYWRHAIFKIDR